MRDKLVTFFNLFLIMAFIISVPVIMYLTAEISALKDSQASLTLELQASEAEYGSLEDKYFSALEKIDAKDERIRLLTEANSASKEQIANQEIVIENFKQNKITLPDSEYQILAKLLFREAGASSWDGMVYTCSAILNLSDYSGRTIMEMAHDKSTFSVAPVVDSAKPTERVYQVIDYVLEGHRVPAICYFRTNHYHSFGVPVCEVGGHYFSRPK